MEAASRSDLEPLNDDLEPLPGTNGPEASKAPGASPASPSNASNTAPVSMESLMGLSDLASRAIVEPPPTADSLIAPDAEALKANELLETSTAVSKALAELDEHLASIGAGITPAPVMRGAPTGAGKANAEKRFELDIDADALSIDDPARPSRKPDTSASGRRPRPSALSTEISGRYARLSIPGTSESGRYPRLPEPSTNAAAPSTSAPSRGGRLPNSDMSESGRHARLPDGSTSDTNTGLRASTAQRGALTNSTPSTQATPEPLAPLLPDELPLTPLPLDIESPAAASSHASTAPGKGAKAPSDGEGASAHSSASAKSESLPASTAQRASSTSSSSGAAGTRSESALEATDEVPPVAAAKVATPAARTKAPASAPAPRGNSAAGATAPRPAVHSADSSGSTRKVTGAPSVSTTSSAGAASSSRGASAPVAANTQVRATAQSGMPVPSVYSAAPSQVPQAATANAPPAAMDRDFIARNQIVERYLSGKLPIKGATDFERFCHDNPELLDEIGLPQRVHAGLRLLEASGKPEPWHETTDRRFWENPALVLGLAGATIALAIAAVFMSQQLSDRNTQIAKLQKAAIEQPLEAAGVTRTIRVLPNRTGSTNTPAVSIGAGRTQLADLRLDMSRSPFRAFRVTIDRIDQGRVVVLHNIYKDSNGHVRIALNSSALGPGNYSFTIEGLTWRGETVPDAWVTIGIQR